jgi:hypothetical protein
MIPVNGFNAAIILNLSGRMLIGYIMGVTKVTSA